MKLKQFIGVMTVGVLFSASVVGKTAVKDKQPLATAQLQGTYVSFQLKVAARNTTVSIVGPNGYHVSKFAKDGIPDVSLTEHGKLKDGLYNYEITSAIGPMKVFKDTMNNGRGQNNTVRAREGVTQSGHFRVVNGQIKKYRQTKESTNSFSGVEW